MTRLELVIKADLKETELRIKLKMQAIENRIKNWITESMLALATLFIGEAKLIISYLSK